jgi:hypothetical protein
MKHEGLSTHRLSSNPMEAAYAEAWRKEAPGTLPYLLHGQDKHDHDLTQQEATIAATIIQWLGSPVGQYFVDEVLAKSGRKP